MQIKANRYTDVQPQTDRQKRGILKNQTEERTLLVGWGVGKTVGAEVSNKMSATAVAASILAWSAGRFALKSGFGGLVSSGDGEKVGFCVGAYEPNIVLPEPNAVLFVTVSSTAAAAS